MTTLSRHLVPTICLACFCMVSLPAQTIDKLYLGRWFNYTHGSPAKSDSNYTLVDTIFELTFRLNGTYNITGYIKTDIFTPGKGHLKFKKNFRYTEGRYEIADDQLELLTVKPADPNLCTLYAFESSTDKFKHVNPYDRLWDTRSFYEYTPVEDFRHSELFYSRKRQQQLLYTANPSGIITDSIAFWNTSPLCAHESQWPKPALIKKDVPLRNDSAGGFDDMTDDLNDSYIFDSTHRLVRYYYTSKKEGSFYYDITYTDSMNGNSTSMKVITDSKDGSRYDFIRDEKNCLLRIEHYNADKGLVETYFSK